MVSGYRAQERDARVRLALDGRSIVRQLRKIIRGVRDPTLRAPASDGIFETTRNARTALQIMPRANGNTQIKLLEVMASVGNEETLDN